MTKNKKKKIAIGTRFFAIMAVIYVSVAFLDYSFSVNIVQGVLKMFLSILPVLAFVFIIMFFINFYLKSEVIKKHLGKETGIKAWLYSMLAGILISGPPYLLYPLLADFKKAGMKDSLAAVFLYNRNVKIPFLPVMIYYFGLKYTIVVSFLIIVFSIFSGLLINVITEEKGTLNKNVSF